MKNLNIIKIKNFEGYWLTCGDCGRKIKHGYKNGVDGMTLGSECVKKLYGKKSKAAIKVATGRMNHLNTLKTLCKKQYEDLKKDFGENVDNMILTGQLT